MTYTIITQGVEQYSDQIQALGDNHRDTLGFLPASIFREYVSDKSLFCAISGEQVIAYILFRYRKTSNSVLLVHVCVSNDTHLQGVGTALINTVIGQYPHAYYVEAKCRRDYKIDDFWRKAGFHVISERAGRKMEGSTLTIWRRRIIKEDLLDLLIQQSSDEKTIAALDSDIIIALCDNAKASTQCLLDSILRDDVLYCITPELADEVNKKEDPIIRAKHLQYASHFQQLNSNGIDSSLVNHLSNQIDPNGSHVEDIRHIVYCIQAKIVDAFITNDLWINSQRDFFAREYGLLIFHPEEFWQHVISRDDQSVVNARIIGSKYRFAPLDNHTLPGAVELHNAKGMKKSIWDAELRSEMVDNTVSNWVLLEKDSVIGLIGIKHLSNYDRIVHFIVNIKENRRVYRFLVMALIEKAIIRIAEYNEIAHRNCTALMVSQSISDSIKSVMYDCGFFELSLGLIRFIATGARKREQLLQNINEAVGLLSSEEPSVNNQFEGVASLFTDAQEDQIERYLSPAVVLDSSMPAYIIAIEPKYAVNLFDEKLAETNISLFDNPFVYAALSSINAYYTRSSIRFPVPCRILWYVKKNDNYAFTGAIRACSIMLSHRYDQTKELYDRYGQLGVLEWKNVNGCEQIGVFTFTNTVLFNTPIYYRDLTRMATTYQTSKIQLQGPYPISGMLAQELLLKGLE